MEEAFVMGLPVALTLMFKVAPDATTMKIKQLQPNISLLPPSGLMPQLHAFVAASQGGLAVRTKAPCIQPCHRSDRQILIWKSILGLGLSPAGVSAAGLMFLIVLRGISVMTGRDDVCQAG